MLFSFGNELRGLGLLDRDRRGFPDGPNRDERAERDDRAAEPDPDDERADENFERRAILLQFAEPRQDQIKIFRERAAMHRAPDRRLLVGKEFQRGGENADRPAAARDIENAFDAVMRRLFDRAEPLELDFKISDLQRVALTERRLPLDAIAHRAGDPERDQHDAEMDDEAAVAPLIAPRERAERAQDSFTGEPPPRAHREGGV